MDKKTQELLKRPLYVYDLPPEVLSTLTLQEDAAESERQEVDTPAPSPIPSSNDHPSRSSSSDSLRASVGSQACSLCGQSFASVQDQRGHLKSDWHHYNLKQKLRGRAAVSEAEFEKLIGTLDESLSGSDYSDTEDEDEDEDATGRKDSTLTALLKKQATLADRSARSNGDAPAEEDDDGFTRKKQRGSGKPPLIWFSSPLLPANNYFGIYRTIFAPEETKNESDAVQMVKKKQLESIPVPKPGPDGNFAPAVYKGPHIFLCMIGGGHFAAMVVSLAPRQTKHGNAGPLNREATVLAHKTFHRYTTRRKQGGSQSANDNAKGNAHSAGSSIRRYNEQALVDEVRLLLHDWKTLLDTSELLFIRATGATNRRTLYGPYDEQVLRANDPRIRGFPFSTRRATQNELMRSFIELTRLKVREFDPAAAQAATKAQHETSTRTTSSKPAKPAIPKLSEAEETAQLHTSQLQAFIRRSKLPALLSYLKSNDLPSDFRFQPAESQQNHHAPTPLHLAASQNSAPLVAGLLGKGGADPTIANGEGKTAFDLAGDRATRDAFRVARHELGEALWDWDAAKVPTPLKREEAEKREERERAESDRKEAERRKAEEERLQREGPKVPDSSSGSSSKGARPGRRLLDGGVLKTAQERREDEARGLTPEQRMKLDRERRARAAEERFKRMQGGSGV
ncbi:Uu.00g114480.m01.CDS01 [Anthostomella pinea]|uniref:Uu.00g114480.m01.CDS01 n=1 Tax=Anthostomella pinea TaxID=933095 RepID=A0AAI8VFL9_9PEZI|nr:Uu.00g114480.m01.CDS01 [Anthostomella pinea]